MKRIEVRKKRNVQKRLRRLMVWSIVFVSAIATALISLRIYAQIAGAPSLTVPKTTIFLDKDGNQFGDKYIYERRYWVPLADISPFVLDATIATEDRDFYEHNGFDYTRIAGAVLKDIKAGRKVEGASTITQQYARNLYLSHDKTWLRKANEALYAYRIEVFYDKDQILEGYLNTVYFGHGMYGIEAASRYYFGKSAKELTLSESALLVAIPKGPSIYSPLVNEEKAKGRQALILSLMKDQNFITEEQKTRALEEHYVLKNEEWQDNKNVAPYLMDTVWEEAEEKLRQAGRRIEEGGWVIQTTLNTFHQKTAEEVIANWMPQNELQVGFVSIEPKTGYITALVGGRDYKKSTFNRVTQAKRQPGSTIKPFLYGAAIEEGYNPLTFLDAGKTVFTYDDGRSKYEPKNVNGEFANQPMSLAQAIAISDNIYAVKTLESVGYKPFRKMIERFDIQADIKDTPAMALGTSEVTLMNLTAGYNTIAAKGVKRNPTTILSITDESGKVVYKAKEPKGNQVMHEDDAFILTHLMTGMFDPVFNDYSPATGISVRAKQTRPYAGKSGSTITDQTMIGFTPTLTAGVWNGYDQGKNLTENQDMRATKQIWVDFMEKVHNGYATEPFLPPDGIEGIIVDIDTGGVATSACKKQRLMYFKKQDVPKKLCTDPTLQKMKKNKDDSFNLFPFSIFEERTDR